MKPSSLLRRPRRLRRTPAIRALVEETRVGPADLIAPLFVREGTGDPEPVGSMPGIVRWPMDRLIVEARELASLGIPGVALFPVTDPALKDPRGTAALDPAGLVPRAVRALKAAVPELLVFTDLALDPESVLGPVDRLFGALGLGGDSSFRAPMAIAVIGGLITSTLLTLVIVPAVFTVIDDVERWIAPKTRRVLADSETQLRAQTTG